MSVKPSWIFGSGREALPDVWERSKGSHGCPVVVGRYPWLSGSGWETIPDVREWSVVPPRHPGVV